MKLAIYQGAGLPEAPEANLDLLQQVSYEAAGHGADLLILPELWLTGYNIGRAAHRLAEPADGPSARRAAEIAAAAGIALLYGYPERAAAGVYNAALLIDGEGRSLASWRKAHLFGEAEKSLFRPGDRELTVVPLGGLKLGILICYDVEFPEAVRALALAGADLVAVPTALMRPFERIAEVLVPARAFENHLHLAYANRCGREGDLAYAGLSSVIAPDGEALATAGREEALIFAEVEPGDYAAARGDNPYLEDRRPALYRRILEPESRE